jgi:hypothetical protein
MSILFKILSSKNLTILVVLSWLVAIVYSAWFIHPKVDDGIYLIPAISTLEFNFPGVNFSNSVEPIFFIFPTQPFLHGVFLKILSFIYIDININTYRLFNSLSVLILLYFTHKLFLIIFSNHDKQRSATNIAFILLGGFSQFSLQFYINRPEILGLVFFILGLIYLIKFIKKIDNSEKNISVACFHFGLCSIIHPNFLLLSVAAFIYCIYLILIYKKNIYLKFTSTFFVPLAAFICWFLVNIDSATDQLFNRVQEVTTISFPSLSYIFSVLFGDNSISAIHNIYLQLHMLTLILVLVSLLFYLVKDSDKKKGLHINKLFKVLGIVVFIILLLMQPYRPNYLLVSYLSIITLSFFIVSHGLRISSILEKNYLSSFRASLLFCCLGLMTLSVPILHLAKNYVSNGMNDNHHKTLEALTPFLHNNQHIFITTAQLLPLFSNNIHNDFKNTARSKSRNIHWYFPVANSPGDAFKKLMSDDIKNEQNIMNSALWGALNITTVFNESMTIACLSLKGGKNVINLHKPQLVFQDKQNIFLTSSEVTPSSKCLINE